MEQFRLSAYSVDAANGTSYVIEGDKMYYYVNDKDDYHSVYPCPVREVAGRFRHNWIIDDGVHEVELRVVEKILQAQKTEMFQRLALMQNEQFHEKRLTLGENK